MRSVQDNYSAHQNVPFSSVIMSEKRMEKLHYQFYILRRLSLRKNNSCFPFPKEK
jgi:hypothetical protein